VEKALVQEEAKGPSHAQRCGCECAPVLRPVEEAGEKATLVAQHIAQHGLAKELVWEVAEKVP
jgi:hypothetical protein